MIRSHSIVFAAGLCGLAWLAIGLGAGSGAAAQQAPPADGGPPVARVVAPAGVVRAGSTIDVQVQASDVVTPLSAYEFALNYDPAVIGFVAIEPGAFLAASGREVTCPNQVDVSAGRARLACASTGDREGVTGSGVLATLTFRALSPGQSPVVLSEVVLADHGRPPVSMATGVVNGQVTVVESGARIYMPIVTRAGAGEFRTYLPLVMKQALSLKALRQP